MLYVYTHKNTWLVKHPQAFAPWKALCLHILINTSKAECHSSLGLRQILHIFHNLTQKYILIFVRVRWHGIGLTSAIIGCLRTETKKVCQHGHGTKEGQKSWQDAEAIGPGQIIQIRFRKPLSVCPNSDTKHNGGNSKKESCNKIIFKQQSKKGSTALGLFYANSINTAQTV